MRVTTDLDHKFDLAIQLTDLVTAHDLIKDDADVDGNELKWKQLAGMALSEGNLPLVLECFTKTRDYASFLLIASCAGDAKMMERLAADAASEKIDNLAFFSRIILGDLEGCLEVSQTAIHTQFSLCSVAISQHRCSLSPVAPDPICSLSRGGLLRTDISAQPGARDG